MGRTGCLAAHRVGCLPAVPPARAGLLPSAACGPLALLSMLLMHATPTAVLVGGAAGEPGRRAPRPP
jgi:hypothetical protein